MKHLGTSLLGLLLLGLTGCGADLSRQAKPSSTGAGLTRDAGELNQVLCTMIFAFGLHIQVALPEGVSGEALEVQVRNASRGTVETFHGTGSGTQDFFAAGEAAGTYDVSASIPGHSAASQLGVVVASDSCHVIGRMVSLSIP